MRLLFLVFLLIFSLNSQATWVCRDLLKLNPDNVSSVFSSPFPQLLLQIEEWRKPLDKRDEEEYGNRSADIQLQIMNLAIQFIQQKKNAEFFFLASQIEFPLNQFMHDNGYASYSVGQSLLEVAILAKNYEVYDRLPTLARENHWSREQVPKIRIWTQKLAETVVTDLHFEKDFLTLPVQQGEPFNSRAIYYGRIPNSILNKFWKVSQSKDLPHLLVLLKDVFSPTSVAGNLGDGDNPGVSAELIFNHSGYQEKREHWLSVQISQSDKLKKGSHSKSNLEKLKFNIRGHRYVGQSSGAGGSYVSLTGQNGFNWIREIKVSSKVVSILIERDAEGIHYDLGTKFQELSLHLDPQGVINRVEIRNGNSLLMRWNWNSHSMQISKDASY